MLCKLVDPEKGTELNLCPSLFCDDHEALREEALEVLMPKTDLLHKRLRGVQTALREWSTASFGFQKKISFMGGNEQGKVTLP